MPAEETAELLRRTAEWAVEYLAALSGRPVSRPVSSPEIVEHFESRLPERGAPPVQVIEQLRRAVDDGLVVANGGRFFGFVEGGVLPSALAADWLTSTWDQNAAFHARSPAAAGVEEVCRRWLVGLLRLPSDASVGFTTGAQMATVVGLAAARHQLFARYGWDVESRGLVGAPRLTVLAGAGRHATVDRALRLLGLGTECVVAVDTDDQGAMSADRLEQELYVRRDSGPLLVCAQAGNVNSGACDPLERVCELAHDSGAWVHVDGAFGLWAAASPRLRHLVAGAERADSWAVDAHKWLNVPYDGAMAFCAHPDAHRAAMTLSAEYLAASGHRDGADWTPESSRRARVFVIWAALRSLGGAGVAELVERLCALARHFAERLAAVPGVRVLNDVVLNQVMIRVDDDDATTARTAAIVQADGATWLGTTRWRGETAIRVSVSDHATTEAHVDLAVEALTRATRAARQAG